MSAKEKQENTGCIGIFNDSYPPIIDGVTLTVENYLYWLDRLGCKTKMVTPWNPMKVEKGHDVIRYFSLPIHNRFPYRYGYPKLDPFIWSKLRRTNFNLLHSHCPFSSGRLAVYVKKKQNIPLIGTFHSKYKADLEHSFEKVPWMVPIIMKRILSFFNSCDEVWIPQAYVEDTVREYGYKGKLTVVENGNDFSSIIKGDLTEYKKAARKRLGFDENSLSLLFVGQHIWEKGIRTILDTLVAIDGKIDFRMDFIGVGYASDDIKKFLKDHKLDDRVRMHGLINDRGLLSDYYAAADLFFFPSKYDNAPLVLREAAAMGTPTMLLKGSTASEVIKDGKNGFLVEPGTNGFISLLQKLHDDRHILSDVAAGARSTLVRSWEDVVEEVSDRYKTILKNYNGNGR